MNFKEEPLDKYDILSLGDDPLNTLIEKGIIIEAHSKWTDEDGTEMWRACQIIGLNREKQTYKIQWTNEKNKKKEVTRLNLVILNENLDEYM